MKNSLKEFIKNNREAFDDKTPGERVWRKIEARLPQMKSVSLWHSVVLWRVAAVLFMGLSLMLFLNSPQNQVKETQAYEETQAHELVGEFKDLENFYSGEIAKKVALIDDFGGSFVGAQFTQDFEKLDAMYQVLRDEMNARPSEKVRDALILNLLVRMDLLNQQIKKLEEMKEERNADASV